MKNIIKIRAIVSLFLLLTFIVVVITAIGLTIAPRERVAIETGWLFFGLDKHQLENLHMLFGYIMSGLVVIHIMLNYKMLINEVKYLFSKH